MIENRHNTLRKKALKKCYSYGEFVNEILKLKWQGKNLFLNGRNLYVDGDIAVTWAKNNHVAMKDKTKAKKTRAMRLCDHTWDMINKWADTVGCSTADILDHLVEEKVRQGGIRRVADVCGIPNYDASREAIETVAKRKMDGKK